MARAYKPRPKPDRVVVAEHDTLQVAEPANARERGIEAPGDPSGVEERLQEAADCWECRLVDAVHRHKGGELWQSGYRVPCNCALVGGIVNGALWDAIWFGHHYRCIWWEFMERKKEVM